MRTGQTLAIAAAALFATLIAPTAAAAQESTSVTGCLSQGDQGGFSITGEDGTVYELASSDVQLEGHQGHKVTIVGTAAGVETGAVSGTDTGMARDTSAASDTGMVHGEMGHAEADAGAPGEARKPTTLNVTSMSMVSASCN
jgi:hypothetical protein